MLPDVQTHPVGVESTLPLLAKLLSCIAGDIDEQCEAVSAVARCTELLAVLKVILGVFLKCVPLTQFSCFRNQVRGDDASALALAIRGCGVGPERLFKPQRAARPLLVEVRAKNREEALPFLLLPTVVSRITVFY